jgi:hypothetical protein
MDIPAKTGGTLAQPFLALMSYAIRWYRKPVPALIAVLFSSRINT